MEFIDIEYLMLFNINDLDRVCVCASTEPVKTDSGEIYHTGSPTEEPQLETLLLFCMPAD